MHARIIRVLLLASVALGAFSSGSALVSAAPVASTSRVAAATPRTAVLAIIRPFFQQSAQSAACNALTGRLVACPVTPRLRAAAARELQWERKHTQGGNGNEFCRCQNTPLRVVVSTVNGPYTTASGRFAQVKTVWYWGSRPTSITWATRHVPEGWQVDNQ